MSQAPNPAERPAYIRGALPFRNEVEGSTWQVDIALAITQEAVEAWDPTALPPRPVTRLWPRGWQPAEPVSLLETMRTAYFGSAGQALPHAGRQVPQIENNLYTWLTCRKKQWKKRRERKRGYASNDRLPQWLEMSVERGERPTPETGFATWLELRKSEWNMLKQRRQAQRLLLLSSGGTGRGS
ncbi:unnamed protein product [Phaeothamnion confervicola]